MSTEDPALTRPGYARENHSLMVMIPVLILMPLTTVLFAIRMWARQIMSGLATEDWVLFFAYLVAMATNSMFIVMVKHGYGLHLETLSPSDSAFTLRTFWLVQMTYKISLQATKISLLLFYIRIFHHIAWFKKVSYSVIGFLLVYLVTTCVTSILQCRPISLAWDKTIPDGQCIDVLRFFVFNGAIALFTDLVVLALPLPLVWGLKLPLGQKLALIPVFGIGIFIVTVSTLRLYALIATPSNDTTYDLSGTLWTIIEFNLAIVCASLPSVRVLLAKMFPRVFRGSSVARYRSRDGAGAGGPAGSWGNKAGPGGWSRVHGHHGGGGGNRSMTMSAITSGKHARDETSSEEIMLESHGGIKKTVQYGVEYGLR
ncbi:hypothetical protein QBC47DRAFT_436311 [Echria macrotheca]|uniref:Rhodopsin domain-containing protein n=1 Tax=Echria macrotheca TaxID=438768 RepID=A0AAJ0BJ66_9PEZI|nr:hypothetical protein QBC47DRAFT_436311 [Echria macrotheca]